MTNERKLKAITLLINEVCTVEMQCAIDERIHREYLALTEASHNAIKILMDNGYSVSVNNGKMIIDYLPL